jgi:hypothetical protein
MESNTIHVDNKTRSNLAYIWTVSINLSIFYIIWRFGGHLEVLTLIIGFIAGTANTILALYFGGVLAKSNLATPGTAEVNISATTSEFKSEETK